jgi:hypothetical protein
VHVRLLSETASELGVARSHKEGLFDATTVYVHDTEFVIRRHLAVEVQGLITLCAREAHRDDAAADGCEEAESQSDVDDASTLKHRDTILSYQSSDSGNKFLSSSPPPPPPPSSSLSLSRRKYLFVRML